MPGCFPHFLVVGDVFLCISDEVALCHACKHIHTHKHSQTRARTVIKCGSGFCMQITSNWRQFFPLKFHQISGSFRAQIIRGWNLWVVCLEALTAVIAAIALSLCIPTQNVSTKNDDVPQRYLLVAVHDLEHTWRTRAANDACGLHLSGSRLCNARFHLHGQSRWDSQRTSHLVQTAKQHDKHYIKKNHTHSRGDCQRYICARYIQREAVKLRERRAWKPACAGVIN